MPEPAHDTAATDDQHAPFPEAHQHPASAYKQQQQQQNTDTKANSMSSGSGAITNVEAFTAAGKPLGEVVVEVKGVTKQYKMQGSDGETVTALKCINLSESIKDAFPPVRRGEFVMIRGPSGGGKTTLLNMIGTIDCPTDGTVTLMGTEVTKESDDNFLSDLRLKHIGFVFQTFNLIPTMSALENVELPMALLGDLDEKQRKSRAKQLLGLVGLRNRVHHLPSELSGGEQQRVTIARSLSNNPAVLLLDEPTGDLDTATTIEVMDLLLNINNLAGTTMIMVTHNPDVECYADRILYVSDGEFAQQATNACPVPLVLEEYEAYLKKVENQATVHVVNAATVKEAAPGVDDDGAATASGSGSSESRRNSPKDSNPKDDRHELL